MKFGNRRGVRHLPAPSTREGRDGGTRLAAQLLRFSSLYSIGMLVAQGVSLGSTFVLVNVLEPSEYGRFALLLFFAAAVGFVVNVGTKPGTMRRVFGSAGDDDDDEMEESPRSQSPEQSLGTGLAVTAIMGITVTVLILALAEPISRGLLGEHDAALVGWAAAAGVCGSVQSLAAVVVWMERRPGTFLALAIAQPMLVAAGTIPLVVSGAGVEGAIAGTAAGAALAAGLSLGALRHSFVPSFTVPEAAAIIHAGIPRIPVILSFWVVGYASVFLVSRYLPSPEVGLFHFASRMAGIAVFVAASYRWALRPLLRTLAFAEVEADHGMAAARGTQFGYFVLLATGTLLTVALLADPIVRAAPRPYEDAAALIPLLAAGLLAPRIFQVLNKSVKFPGKGRLFAPLAVGGAVTFVGGAILLLPQLGAEGVPLAMLGAYSVPVAILGAVSQRSRSPIAMPYRRSLIAITAAVFCWIAYELIAPASLPSQLAWAGTMLALWLVTIVISGALPREHRHLVRPTVAAAIRDRSGGRLDPEAALKGLSPGQRDLLRRVITAAGGDESGSTGEPGSGAAPLRALRTLRHGARAAGGSRHRASPHDTQVSRYLFERDSVAARDALGRHLLRAGAIGPAELSELEELVTALRGCADEVWNHAERTGGDQSFPA